MKTFLTFAMIAAAGTASAATLTFDEDYASLPDAIRLGIAIDPSYGDTSLVNVDSGLYADFTSTQKADQPVAYYDNYGGMGYGEGAPSGVAISSVDKAVAEFSFTARKPGYSITLDSFDVASFPNGTTEIEGGFTIFDGEMNLLWSQLISVGGPVETIITGITAVDKLIFRWGTSFDIGVDNISFSVKETGPVSAVPLPASLPLLAGALAMVGGFLRRRS